MEVSAFVGFAQILLDESGEEGELIFVITNEFWGTLSVDVKKLVFVGAGSGRTRGDARVSLNGRGDGVVGGAYYWVVWGGV